MAFSRSNNNPGHPTPSFLSPRGEGGAAVFYTIVVFPFVVTLTLLAIDLSRYYSAVEQLYDRAEQIAYHTAHLLPNRERADLTFNRLITEMQRNDLTGALTFDTDGSADVTVQLSSNFTPLFGIFVRFVNPNALSLALTAKVTASLTPTETVIIVSDGPFLRPPAANHSASTSDFDSWGSDIDWPIAPYLQVCSVALPSNDSPLPPWILTQDRNSLRWATQSCFNPIWSIVKLAVIHGLDELTILPTNRASAIFYPGEEDRVIVLKDLTSESPPYLPSTDQRPDPELIADSSCAVFAGEAGGIPNPYRLISPMHGSRNAECSITVSNSQCTGPVPVRGEAIHLLCETGVPSPRQLIYWHKAQPLNREAIAETRFVTALTEAQKILLSSTINDSNSPSTHAPLRALAPVRRIFAVVDQLPDPEAPGFSQLLADISGNGIGIVILGLNHSGLPAEQLHKLNSRLQTLQIQADTLENSSASSATIQVLNVTEPHQLEKFVVPALSAIGHEITLRRIEIW